MKAKPSNKICHCSILHKLDDSRIFYKECVSLASAGFDVTFIAKPVTNDHFHKASYKGVKLQTLQGSIRLYNNYHLFISILKQKMKIIHFHDPELIVIGLFLKLLGKKVIYDVHENVRQDMLHKMWLRPSLRILLSKVAEFLEFLASVFFNGIVTATPIIAKNFTNRNTYIIRNFPLLREQDLVTATKREKEIVIYIGTLSEARGIKELINCAEYLGGIAELWLLGGWIDDAFKQSCERLPGFLNTRYLGLVNHEEVVKVLSEASIGVCTLYPLDTFKDSYPTKVFEYMQNGLPVLMSDFEMWQVLFGKFCEYVDPMNPKLMAEKIKGMLENPERLEEMSVNGIIVINEQFNWDSEAKSLEELYSKI
jgi:glycosyltransferase involved in cell wall biosynthesis